MTKVIDDVIEFAKSLAKQGFKLHYKPEKDAPLVQVYIEYGKAIVTGPPRWVSEIKEAIENN